MSIQTEIDRIITAVGNAYDAIGAKGGTVPTDETVANLAGAINTIPAGAADPVLQEKSVTPSTAPQTVTPDAGYDGLSKVDVAAMPAAEQATPSITVSASGLITAQATQSAGYVAAGSRSATKQLTTQSAKTITPGTSDQTAIARGRYTTGAVTVKGDSNLVPENIRIGASIFGVNGEFSGGVIPVVEGTFFIDGEFEYKFPIGICWLDFFDSEYNRDHLFGSDYDFNGEVTWNEVRVYYPGGQIPVSINELISNLYYVT